MEPLVEGAATAICATLWSLFADRCTVDACNLMFFVVFCPRFGASGEWVACNDTVFATLADGTSSFADRTFGLYVGSPAAVTLPAMPDDSTLLLFQSLSIDRVTISVGTALSGSISTILTLLS